MTARTLEPELLHKMDAYWRAANYLSVGQIYLYDNPLLKRPLHLKQAMADKLVEHNLYINAHGQDLPEIRNWTWNPPQITSTPPMGGRTVFAEFPVGQRRRDNTPTSGAWSKRHDR